MMRVVVVGAGPVGVVTAIGLARQGHAVTVVDRDPGPPEQGPWNRTGVMQYRQPHGYRPTVHNVLADLMPDVWGRLTAAGCASAPVPGAPPGTFGLMARRSTLERGLRQALAAQPRITVLVGHVGEIVVDGSRLVGVRVAGEVVEAECVVVATGRAGRLGGIHRATPEGGPSGFAYTSRVYRARPGVETPASPIPVEVMGEGYLSMVFPQEAGFLSVLIVRPSTDTLLAGLRHDNVFDSVAARIPHLAPWVDPERFDPVSHAMPGGGLANHFHSVLDATGRCAVPGLLFVGDAVLTTNPYAGRGVATGLEQARVLLRLMAEHPDPADVAVAFDAWCFANLRPWFEDHVSQDAGLLHRWSGRDLDLRIRIPSDVVCAAAEVDPRITPAARAYRAMMALPKVLDPFQATTRSLLQGGWRPPIPEGPTAEELAEVVLRSLPVVPAGA